MSQLSLFDDVELPQPPPRQRSPEEVEAEHRQRLLDDFCESEAERSLLRRLWTAERREEERQARKGGDAAKQKRTG